jgi:dATP pyrophosphohydrolase
VGTDAVPLANLLDWQRHIEYDIYPVWRHRYAPGVTRNVEHWFSLRVPRAIEVRLDPREHTRFRWLPLEDAAAACFSPSNGAAIRELPQHLGAGR